MLLREDTRKLTGKKDFAKSEFISHKENVVVGMGSYLIRDLIDLEDLDDSASCSLKQKFKLMWQQKLLNICEQWVEYVWVEKY